MMVKDLFINIRSYFEERRQIKQSGLIFCPSLFIWLFYLIVLLLIDSLGFIAILRGEDLFSKIGLALLFVGFNIYFILDLLGSYIGIVDGFIIKRKFFFRKEQLVINSFIVCDTLKGKEKAAKAGAFTLRIKNQDRFIDISEGYYTKENIFTIKHIIEEKAKASLI